ncbi:MAG: hypothetical protein JW709_11890 [Sedimentisphaerales bacterium]|nr:hypothetical protein [Sedimentisphaerales bacterium]
MSSKTPDYIVDIKNGPWEPCGQESQITQGQISAQQAGKRPYISILFDCCGVYQRIYRNRTATAYEGCCPRCLRQVCVRIGEGGTSQRFFRAR